MLKELINKSYKYILIKKLKTKLKLKLNRLFLKLLQKTVASKGLFL
jgi:hypothetical protein